MVLTVIFWLYPRSGLAVTSTNVYTSDLKCSHINWNCLFYKTDPGETGPSTVLPDPACKVTQINEKEEKEDMDIKKGFVVKEEEGEMMISKEEGIEEAICQTIVPCE